MSENTKEFDCVEFMHRAGQKLREKLAGMSEEEVREYWERKHREHQALGDSEQKRPESTELEPSDS